MRVTTGKMRYSAASSARLTVRCVDRPEPERRRLTALGRISTFVRLRQVNTEAHPWPPVCCVHDGLPAVKGILALWLLFRALRSASTLRHSMRILL